MPTYVYECAKCGDEFELYQSFSDDPLEKHPGCGGKVAKVFQPVGIVLKGSGFYKNDSRNGGRKSKGVDAPKADAGSKAEKAEAKRDSSASDGSASGSKSGTATKSDNGSSPPKKSEPSTSASKSS
jgi:putative FmdB family regulatory protein